ncbi:FdtA/QdtA family cupin domain-containing protein [Gammaproteobacteria bacterium]|nr:FdtA/QdtA family cupin domain-containing protein [Gammaproteobacteria bacterium]
MISNCRLFDIQSFEDERGGLSFIEPGEDLKFNIARLYYLYRTSKNALRGVHAHKQLEQVLISLNGSFEVLLSDGIESQTFLLDRPNLGLYVCPMIWRELNPIEDNSICAVLASRPYEEDDYIHNYDDFLSIAKKS